MHSGYGASISPEHLAKERLRTCAAQLTHDAINVDNVIGMSSRKNMPP